MPGLTGRLDQRFRLYSYAATQTSGGVLEEAFTYEATRWGRLEPPTGREVTLGAAERGRVDGILTMRSEVLTSPGLDLRWRVKPEGAGGEDAVGGWWLVVSPPLRRRAQQVVQFLLQWADDDQASVTVAS